MRRGGTIRLIAEREIRERVSGRVTRIVTVATAILVVAGIAIPGLVKSSESSTKIGLVGSRSQVLAPALGRAAKTAQVTVRLSATIAVKESLSAETRAVIAAALDEEHFRTALAKAGVPLAKVLPAVTPVALLRWPMVPVWPFCATPRAVSGVDVWCWSAAATALTCRRDHYATRRSSSWCLEAESTGQPGS